jgi:hypothetical protein
VRLRVGWMAMGSRSCRYCGARKVWCISTRQVSFPPVEALPMRGPTSGGGAVCHAQASWPSRLRMKCGCQQAERVHD